MVPDMFTHAQTDSRSTLQGSSEVGVRANESNVARFTKYERSRTTGDSGVAKLHMAMFDWILSRQRVTIRPPLRSERARAWEACIQNYSVEGRFRIVKPVIMCPQDMQSTHPGLNGHRLLSARPQAQEPAQTEAEGWGQSKPRLPVLGWTVFGWLAAITGLSFKKSIRKVPLQALPYPCHPRLTNHGLVFEWNEQGSSRVCQQQEWVTGTTTDILVRHPGLCKWSTT